MRYDIIRLATLAVAMNACLATCASAGYVYVTSGSKIFRYDTSSLNGTLIKQTETVFTTTGLSSPYGLAIDSEGNVYAANVGTAQVTRYDRAGNLTATIGTGQLVDPIGLAFDSAGTLFVASDGTSSVKKFDATGTLTGTITTTDPRGLAIDASDNLYVANYSISIIGKYGSDGTSLGTFASGAGGPTGVAVDAAGNVYSSSWGSGVVKKYSSAGVLLNGTIGNGLLTQPYGLDIDDTGNLFVASYGTSRVRVFSPQGTAITDWTVSNPLWVATSAVPEPSAIAVVVMGIIAAGSSRRRTARRVHRAPWNWHHWRRRGAA